MHYTIDIAGMKRDLTLYPVNDKLYIAALIILGDQELTVHTAAELLKVVPEYDYLLTAEAKSIPLIHEMARQKGDGKYIVARKASKIYMKDPVEVKVRSITTDREQVLILGQEELDMMHGKRILVIDDVVSTGESLHALLQLIEAAKAEVAGIACILAEGDAAKRDDLIYLAPLPLFDEEGKPIE